MANPTTAAEWKQVAANSLTQIKQIEAGIDTLYAQRKALDPQIAALVAKRDSPSSDSFDRALFQNQIRALIDQQINIDNNVSEQVRQVVQLTATYDNALKQVGLAESGPPDSLTTTPPVSENPDKPNTTVTTTTEPTPNTQDTIDPNSDPNTNIGAEVQTTGFEPLQEPPNTEVDEFSGIDEQIQRQKDIEDGTSEFAGIDDQIATNENTLQEPPLLTDEEVEAELDRVSAENREQNDEATQTNVVGSTNSALNSNPAVTVTPYKQDDWRIRLSLSGSANYLYKIAEKTDILYPLIATDGVVFPYTPTINSSYRANYDPAELTHSNYKMFFYKNSSVDDISITADFTAQDTAEANYMLAVIHFFKSATKMFYGQDTTPRAGTPPPLLYLTGYGLHQFQKHPLLLTSFSYNLPNDVDYIRAGSNSQWGGVSIAQMTSGSRTRLGSSGLTPGGVAKPAAFNGLASQDKVTYVPTKISLSLTLSPVVTRNDISKNFSLKDYAAGKLSAKTGGGIW